jgi:hypothetical protein
VLSTDEGCRLLREVTALKSIMPGDLARLHKTAPRQAVSAALGLARARAKAAQKFARGELMWVEPTAVEQATAELVARHKAARFECSLVVDLCAGIGGDTLTLAARSHVLSVDRDRGMCRRLQFNAAVYGVARNVQPVQARAETFAVPKGAWLHLDPDRRITGPKRAATLDLYNPPPQHWTAMSQQVAAGAIKLSPASDFADHFGGSAYEIELVSLRGECKEATVWFGELVSCRRRATCLPENATWTDRDGPFTGRVAAVPLGAIIYDPDPALRRAGLLDSFAHAHGLHRVAPDVDYLTGGDNRVVSPFLNAFAVGDVCPFDLRRLRAMLAAHAVNTLVIKVRGVDVTPERLRGKLRLRGSREATLLLFGGPSGVRAVLAQRISTGGSTVSSTEAAGAAAAGDSAKGGAPLPRTSA